MQKEVGAPVLPTEVNLEGQFFEHLIQRGVPQDVAATMADKAASTMERLSALNANEKRVQDLHLKYLVETIDFQTRVIKALAALITLETAAIVARWLLW